MKKEVNRTWYYDTLCHRCGKINVWVLTLNGETEKVAENIVNAHKVYSDKYPFDIKHCGICLKDTRQERVAWYSIRHAEG